MLSFIVKNSITEWIESVFLHSLSSNSSYFSLQILQSTYIVASWTHDRRRNASLDETETAYDVWKSFKENFCQWPKKRTVRLTNRLWGLKKGTRSLDEYLRDFKGICNALAAVSKLVSDLDKVFQLAQVLETKYMDSQVSMLSKSPYPSYNQFVLAL